MAPLTSERLRELLHYDPETGVFTWLRIEGKSSCKVGDAAGSRRSDRYIRIGIGRKRYLAHRLAWLYITGLWPKGIVDHWDTNPSNNRWLNLRDTTPNVNQQNQRKAHSNNKLGILGVRIVDDAFQAQIRAGGRTHTLGTFVTPEQAYEAYLDAKRRLHEGCTL